MDFECQDKPNRKNRNKAYVRHQRRRIIEKKKRIYLKFWNNNELFFPEGKFSKGKVHCSCWMCSEKSKVWGFEPKEQAKWTAMEREWKDFKNGGDRFE